MPRVCEQVAVLSTPLWGVLAICLGVILILAHFATKKDKASTGDAFTLGTSSLGIVAGVQLVLVSVATLGCESSAGPFGADDLGFIAISAAILALVSYKAITETFHKPGR